MQKLKATNPTQWRALSGRYYSPQQTIKDYFGGKVNDITPVTDCYYTDFVEWPDPNGGKVRLLIEMNRGLYAGKMVYGITVLVITNYLGCKDKYFVGRMDSLCNLFDVESQARWYCKDLLDAEYTGDLNLPEHLK